MAAFADWFRPKGRHAISEAAPGKCQGCVTLNVRSTSAHARLTARAFGGVNVQEIS